MTYQAHRAVTQPGDLRSILAEFGGRQLGVTCNLANDFLDLVHSVCCVVCFVSGCVERGSGCCDGGRRGDVEVKMS